MESLRGGDAGGSVCWSDGSLVAHLVADPAPMSLVVARPEGSVLRTITDIQGGFRLT